MPSKIEDYAFIGDCETAALVNREGSIDWLCWPDFSSSACFSALLGSEENGYWKICPLAPGFKSTRQYLDRTLILETTFETEEGAVRLVDFMPIRENNSVVVRIVEGVRGSVDLCMELALRFDYGRTVPWVTALDPDTRGSGSTGSGSTDPAGGDPGIRAVAGPAVAVLLASVPMHGAHLKTEATFTVREGERAWFTLTYGDSWRPDPEPTNAEQALRDTIEFWTNWTSTLQYEGEYRDVVLRSLITLKAMTFHPTGGLVAAMTTSLPEAIGGPRNWDYRYCWLRDTTFTLLAMTTAGYYEEAAAWQQWLLRAIAGSPDQVQIMYGIKGERQLIEWEIDWLPGYENSHPVRIGNAASGQVQLDIYGELLDTFFHALQGMGRNTPEDFKAMILLLNHLETIWENPDEGIWETRGGPQQFTYSKMMAWVAFDRAILIADKLQSDAPIERWQQLRDKIHDQICTKAFNEKKNTFVQAYGSDQLDAALLLMPLVGFLPPTDPRVRSTIEAIERELMPDGFVLRYDTSKVNDGLPPGEGVFLACSFWMVDCLKAIGREHDAHKLFKRLLSLCNDVGLLSEEYDIQRKRLVGNFPQAFSHIALMNAAFDLEGRDGARRRAHRRHAEASAAKS